MVQNRYNNYIIDFEFDKKKSEINKQKHGIDFNEAKELWEDPDYIDIPVKTIDEPRFLIIGKISEKHWTGVITYRNERIRIISIRRSRKEEIDIYESQ